MTDTRGMTENDLRSFALRLGFDTIHHKFGSSMTAEGVVSVAHKYYDFLSGKPSS